MKRIIILSGLAAALATATPAMTQHVSTQPPLPQAEVLPACAERGRIVEKLSRDFQEAPAALGMVSQDAVLEIFVSDAGTWTILATSTDGQSCVVSAGEGWQSTMLMAGEGV